jgi:hypothetical protein
MTKLFRKMNEALRDAPDIFFRRRSACAFDLAETKKLDLPVVGPIGGAATDKMIESFYAVSPALIARARAIITK